MATIQAQLPDPLAQQVAELAAQEKVSVDQSVSIALSCRVFPGASATRWPTALDAARGRTSTA
jgi:hypothetical protein